MRMQRGRRLHLLSNEKLPNVTYIRATNVSPFPTSTDIRHREAFWSYRVEMSGLPTIRTLLNISALIATCQVELSSSAAGVESEDAELTVAPSFQSETLPTYCSSSTLERVDLEIDLSHIDSTPG